MSGEMDPFMDRDHHKACAEAQRSDTARCATERDLERLAHKETKAKLAELREMERERNAWRHGFERLAGLTIGGITTVSGIEDIEAVILLWGKASKKAARNATLAKRIRDAVRVDLRQA